MIKKYGIDEATITQWPANVGRLCYA